MKYDGSRKVSRNLALVDYKNSNPKASWRKVGEQFDITRQRAATIFGSMARREKIQ